jgi:single-strand DNA-binding protein
MDLSLAMDYGKKGADGKRPTQWVSATMWGDRVEKLQSHLVKGQSLFVTLSEPHLEEYKRKDGTTGTSLRARLNELEFAGAPRDKVREEPKIEDLDSDIPF